MHLLLCVPALVRGVWKASLNHTACFCYAQMIAMFEDLLQEGEEVSGGFFDAGELLSKRDPFDVWMGVHIAAPAAGKRRRDLKQVSPQRKLTQLK